MSPCVGLKGGKEGLAMGREPGRSKEDEVVNLAGRDVEDWGGGLVSNQMH
jgi:hypothetical protein